MTIDYKLTQKDLDALAEARGLCMDMMREETRSPGDVKALEAIYWWIREVTDKAENR